MINKGDSFKWEPANQDDNDTDHDDDDKEASQSDVEDRDYDNDDVTNLQRRVSAKRLKRPGRKTEREGGRWGECGIDPDTFSCMWWLTS